MSTKAKGLKAQDDTREYEGIETGYSAVRWKEPVLYELSRTGSRNNMVPDAEAVLAEEAGDVLARIPKKMRRAVPPAMPELSEPEVMRHYLRLSQQTFGFDTGVSIGSGTCTMKYSPKLNDQLARMPSLNDLHPLQPEETLQGILEIMYELRNWLCEIAGMDEFSFQPRGGSHGIYANACIIRAYHRARGDHNRNEIITCSVSHPSDAGCPSAAGFKVIELYPDKATGNIGLDQLKAAISDRTAGLMITAPYDTGVFDSELGEYVKAVHDAGGLVALDQANFNGVMTRLRAGDAGADLMQFNLHKTFSAPHGSYGPATGAIGARKELRGFMPVPLVTFDGTKYALDYDLPQSIGKVGTFNGVLMNVVKAYAWIMSMGYQGLRQAAEWAVINNNYLVKKMLEVRGVGVAWPHRAKLQETRFTLQKMMEETGIGSVEVDRRIADFGVQTFFRSHEPMIIPEPVTLECGDSASREDLDLFVEAFRRVSEEAYRDPEIVRRAPHRCAVHQIDPGPLQEARCVIGTWRRGRKNTGG
jgi:glycine dehydrogenase subunit 2